ncbi:Ribonuclease H [Fusarium albosuccineum]|uniref:Ribonuclease H n=1 Tax=Fusarium albosuccineum TaxID=1237068 RepID=A0A8H4PKG6_9HYPO|nr:Ribonuclease H [Fusarium albosuccineum]
MNTLNRSEHGYEDTVGDETALKPDVGIEADSELGGMDRPGKGRRRLRSTGLSKDGEHKSAHRLRTANTPSTGPRSPLRELRFTGTQNPGALRRLKFLLPRICGTSNSGVLHQLRQLGVLFLLSCGSLVLPRAWLDTTGSGRLTLALLGTTLVTQRTRLAAAYAAELLQRRSQAERFHLFQEAGQSREQSVPNLGPTGIQQPTSSNIPPQNTRTRFLIPRNDNIDFFWCFKCGEWGHMGYNCPLENNFDRAEYIRRQEERQDHSLGIGCQHEAASGISSESLLWTAREPTRPTDENILKTIEARAQEERRHERTEYQPPRVEDVEYAVQSPPVRDEIVVAGPTDQVSDGDFQKLLLRPHLEQLSRPSHPTPEEWTPSSCEKALACSGEDTGYGGMPKLAMPAADTISLANDEIQEVKATTREPIHPKPIRQLDEEDEFIFVDDDLPVLEEVETLLSEIVELDIRTPSPATKGREPARYARFQNSHALTLAFGSATMPPTSYAKITTAAKVLLPATTTRFGLQGTRIPEGILYDPLLEEFDVKYIHRPNTNKIMRITVGMSRLPDSLRENPMLVERRLNFEMVVRSVANSVIKLGPWKMIAMDYLSPITTRSSSKHAYILLIVDYMTTFIAGAAHFEATGGEKPLKNHAMNLTAEKHGTILEHGRVSHPQSTGLVESTVCLSKNRLMKSAVKLNGNSLEHWDKALPLVLITMNSRHVESIRSSPALVMYEFQPFSEHASVVDTIYLEDTLLHHGRVSREVDLFRIDALEEQHELIRDVIVVRHTKTGHQSAHGIRTLRAGTKVWEKQGKSRKLHGKLHKSWVDMSVMLAQLSNVTFFVQSIMGPRTERLEPPRFNRWDLADYLPEDQLQRHTSLGDED